MKSPEEKYIIQDKRKTNHKLQRNKSTRSSLEKDKDEERKRMCQRMRE